MKLSPHFLSLGLAMLSILLIFYYHGKYTEQLNKAVQLQSELLEQQNEIVNQQERIRLLSELDNQHTKELAHAKSEIDVLRNDVAAGHRRLRIAATCNQGKAGSSSGMDDAASPRLEDSAIRDYFTLTERVTTMQAQLEGLQDYIKTQCQ
ncbi:lysis protein [Photorhabdus namnaonensis]|uniref:Bacteriophage lysis protein n=1 Tax=Photorhabdus namnaonensis TaxID=1851568 RepID=A0A1B8YFT1_9GAMM|nr:lysis protein [Photorhabdus namnaonensis]OCA53927.1 Bacteriophage lysis protein [Photorhabdus namnaonensis]